MRRRIFNFRLSIDIFNLIERLSRFKAPCYLFSISEMIIWHCKCAYVLQRIFLQKKMTESVLRFSFSTCLIKLIEHIYWRLNYESMFNYDTWISNFSSTRGIIEWDFSAVCTRWHGVGWIITRDCPVRRGVTVVIGTEKYVRTVYLSRCKATWNTKYLSSAV